MTQDNGMPFHIRPANPVAVPERYAEFPVRGRQSDGFVHTWTQEELDAMVRAYDAAVERHGISETLMAVVAAWQRHWRKE